MGEVIGGIYTPLVTRVWVWCVLDPIGHWILLTILHYYLHSQCCLGRDREGEKGIEGRRERGIKGGEGGEREEKD